MWADTAYRDEGLVRSKAVYVALGVTPEGTKDILGLWIETSEGAKFWLRVMTELKNRGVEDILIAVVDGLRGFPEAIAAVFPPTIVQTCIVHLIRAGVEILQRPAGHIRVRRPVDRFEFGGLSRIAEGHGNRGLVIVCPLQNL